MRSGRARSDLTADDEAGHVLERGAQGARLERIERGDGLGDLALGLGHRVGQSAGPGQMARRFGQISVVDVAPADGPFPDASSAAGGSLVLVVRTSTATYQAYI